MNREDPHFVIGTNSSPRQVEQKKKLKGSSGISSSSTSDAGGNDSIQSTYDHDTEMLSSPCNRLRHLEEPSLESSFHTYSSSSSSSTLLAAPDSSITKKWASSRFEDYSKHSNLLTLPFNVDDASLWKGSNRDIRDTDSSSMATVTATDRLYRNEQYVPDPETIGSIVASAFQHHRSLTREGGNTVEQRPNQINIPASSSLESVTDPNNDRSPAFSSSDHEDLDLPETS